jgi:hypothetical protein
MNQFCIDVMEFLKSEYSDAYEYNMEVTHNLFGEPTAELSIRIGKGYTIKVGSNSMTYLYKLYRAGIFIKERGQWEWQKELVDIIEGS